MIVVTTRSGTEYQLGHSETQADYVRWVDTKYDGPEGCQGGRVKVIEHVTFVTKPKVGELFKFYGTDRYTYFRRSIDTSPVVSIETL